MTLDEGKDVLLGQLVWILGLLGIAHMEAISPLPEEPGVVAGTIKGREGAVRVLYRGGLSLAGCFYTGLSMPLWHLEGSTQ